MGAAMKVCLNADVGESFGRFELGNGARKKLSVAPYLPVYYFRLVMHTSSRARTSLSAAMSERDYE